MQPWIISVLSTDYDLQEHRKALISMLEVNGILVSAFEKADFPVETNLSSHDSCCVAIDRADIVLVIINRRSGGIYKGIDENKKEYSITEQEYFCAIKKKKPVFVFVHQKSYDDLHNYKEQFKHFCKNNHLITEEEQKAKQEEFDKKYHCCYVDKVETLHFIDDIQKAYDTWNDVSNWMSFYTDIESLKQNVQGKLEGYSRAFLSILSGYQRRRVLSRHTSTALNMSLGDVFSSNYYIEPPYKVVSGSDIVGEADVELSRTLESVLSKENSVLIYGEAGYGKTTLIAKCFCDHADSPDSLWEIPLFIPLKNRGRDYSFELQKYIAEETEALLHKSTYPYLTFTGIALRFYCDGFDELTETLTEDDLERIGKSEIFQYPIILTCRQQFMNRYLNTYSFSDIFSVRIRMEEWGISTVENYIEKYYENNNLPKAKKEELLRSIRNNTELQDVISSPLLITLFLNFLEEHRQKATGISRVELFDDWMRKLALREHSKNPGISSEKILDIWKFVAWLIYLHRRSGKKLKIDDLERTMVDRFKGINIDTAISTFAPLFERENDCVIATFHEQFMEYLVASLLIDACIDKRDPYPAFLKHVLRPEINKYFRGIWEEKSLAYRNDIYKAIVEQYFNSVGKTDSESVAIRVHAIYHMCRIESEQRNNDIQRAFACEKNESVLLSLYFGAIKVGMIDKEEEFYQLLHKESFSEANRGYHLTYYADILPIGVLPYADDGASTWEGTLKAIISHFEMNDIGHYYLRRIELYTIQELIKRRGKVNPLTEEVLQHLKECIDISKYAQSPENKEYNKKLLIEYEKLEELFNSLVEKESLES